MTLLRLAAKSALFYRRTHAAVAVGVAAAVAVLAGSLLVGASVRASLAALADRRTGSAAAAIVATTPFTEAMSDRLVSSVGDAVPLISLTGVVSEQRSGRRASNVLLYGVDARFFKFHGVPLEPPTGSEILLSPDLADELDVNGDEALVVRVARPTDIPVDSLHGRREDIGRSIRLRFTAVLDRDQMGEFSLAPGQGPVRAAFVPLDRLQRDLGIPGRANTILLAPGRPDAGSEGAALDESGVSGALRSAATLEDYGLTFATVPGSTSTIVEASSGVLADGVADAILTATGAADIPASPVLTWLANRIVVGGKTVPYSLVAALTADAVGDDELARMLAAPAGTAPPIVLTEWAARDLGATVGAPVELEYYRWADEGRLVTERATFSLAGVLPMRGLAIDRRLAPEYPGITNSESVSDWDPPFPIDLTLVRPVDEAFWREHRTSPKAFIQLEAGQRIWRTRHGGLTSIRLQTRDGDVNRMREAIRAAVMPADAGLTVVDVASLTATAATGATDFGAYFSYFSFFLMVAALLLAALFFRLSIEQRLPQIGVLRAAGFPLATVRRALTIEGIAVAAVGGALGVLLAIGWAALMMFGLRTWWVGAVGTTDLELHVDWRTLAVGVAAGLIAAVVSIAITVRGLARFSARALLTGAGTSPVPRTHSRARAIAIAAAAVAMLLSALAILDIVPPAAGFFGAATLMLVAGLAAFGAAIASGSGRQRRESVLARRESAGIASGAGLRALALANLAWRPGRSLTVAGLVAAAAFLLVSVDAFRKGDDGDHGPASGVGGFALIGETALPVVHDLSTPEGREAAGIDTGDPLLAELGIQPLRLRPGDDASCLNLYTPTQPRIIGVPDRLVESRRFRFARSVAATEVERDNPWRLLGPPDAAGVVPAIADATSLQYVLHARVGDEITIDADTARPVQLRIVASLDDSVLQGEILIAEDAFAEIFPGVAGYRVFLVDVPGGTPERVDTAAQNLERALEPFGLDVQQTTTRLAAYHRVENTYLSTFQALGGLGLVLGSFGLMAVIARNVLERRRELALLGASGYTGRQLQKLVAIEHVAVVFAGLAIGLAAALIAVAPVALERSRGVPWGALVWLIAVGVIGMIAAIWATRTVRRLPLLASLRSE
jgi:ABC-type lipoprotein release transport system permease subunit